MDITFMDITFVTISRLSSEIIDTETIKIENADKPMFEDLTDYIYDKYRNLKHLHDYKFFWNYAKSVYFQIYDYITYIAALRLMLDKTIYILLYDVEDYWKDNISYLEELDRIEEEERKERERDIYDVRIGNKNEESVVAIDERSIVESRIYKRAARTVTAILDYALRKMPDPLGYTSDMSQQINLMLDLQKGYPRFKTELRPIPDKAFDKRVFKAPKGKKKDKKGGKKNKKGGKKKDKKGGKKKK